MDITNIKITHDTKIKIILHNIFVFTINIIWFLLILSFLPYYKFCKYNNENINIYNMYRNNTLRL